MNRQDFWEDNHNKNDNYWLTGSLANQIFNIHELKDVVNKRVLEIGIGLGYFTKELFLLNNQVYACDISQNALNRVKDFSKTYLTQELKVVEPVDLAICHLVFQHCDDTEIERIINDVNLTQDGVFTFQFAYLRDDDPPNEIVTSFINNKSHYFRSLEKIKDIIERSNKKIMYISNPMHYYKPENFSWYIIKVINK
jgi:SAM-dependent methyltransferase